MTGLREYLISVVAVCLLAALAMAVVQQGKMRGIVRLISGLLVVLTVLQPLPSLDWTVLTEGLLSIGGSEFDSNAVQREYQARLRENIKRDTRHYIEKKAEELGAFVRAEVELSDGDYPIPVAVRLIGLVNHRQLTELTIFISEGLGIPAERQEWTMDEAD